MPLSSALDEGECSACRSGRLNLVGNVSDPQEAGCVTEQISYI